jgi:hypothetical protein
VAAVREGGMQSHTFDAPGFVSIWVGTFPSEEVRERHLRERYEDREDDEPLAEWMGEFGLQWFDHDFMDTNCRGLTSQPLPDLLSPCSYSTTFLNEAVRTTREQGITETQFVMLLDDFRYDPAVTGITRGRYLRFLGSFPYSVGVPG